MPPLVDSALLPSATSATQTPAGGGTLIFVSGPEGSGTTMLQRVLCESDTTLCFFTSPSASALGLSNTQLLSQRAQRKYALLGEMAAEDEFNEATRALWWDGADAYATNDADTRPRSQRDAQIKAAGAAACTVLRQSAAVGLNITALAIHRSIPYGGAGALGRTGGGMPHLEDLPDLAHEIGACLGGDGASWDARATFVLRAMPEAWMSHGQMDTASATLPIVERRLRRGAGASMGASVEASSAVSPAPLRFARLLAAPREELRCLAAAWGGIIEPDELLASPDLLGMKPRARRAEAQAAALAVGRTKPAPLTDVLAAMGEGGKKPAALTDVLAALGASDDGGHSYTKEDAERRWEEMRHDYPTVDAILESSDGCAQDVAVSSAAS